MHCYRDKTFCEESTCKQFKTCPDALTNDVRMRAVEWFGSEDVPISVYMGRMECYEKPYGHVLS